LDLSRAGVGSLDPAAAGLPSAALDYVLPPGSIATRPAEPRDAARMLVCRRGRGPVEHRIVRDLPEYLAGGDILVVNDTAVVPARLVGRRVEGGGRVEGLFLAADASGRWRVMLRANRRLGPGERIGLEDHAGAASPYRLRLLEREGECWIAAAEPAPPAGVGVLDLVGRTPLPPYIRRARGSEVVEEARDRGWYQTVYADAARRGSVAAPTAGLHFTPTLLEALERRGVRRLGVTLHVGPGTFKPVTAATLGEHAMHAEWFEVPVETLQALHGRRGAGGAGPAGRVIAVGTTSVRALESLPSPLPAVEVPWRASTELLVAPGYGFKLVDGMLTNFHLPRSTLLALVAAMVGLERLHAIYREAIERGYRFYSYGDAMLILP
jgi:S-adenosylmethionine:tRNA ribosyltransferase-isomerase